MGLDFVTQEDRQGNVTRAWVPLFPAMRANKSHRSQVVLITSRLPDSSEGIARFRDKTSTATGLIINDVHSLRSQEKDNLESHYPDVDFSDVLLLEEGREPPSAGRVYGLLGGGGGLVFLGVVCGGLALIFALRGRDGGGKPRRSQNDEKARDDLP
jgi:hypothetical protein